MWPLLPFVILPIVEIALFIQMGGLIGLWPTIGLVVLSAVAGSWLMRQQGAAALADLQRSQGRGLQGEPGENAEAQGEGDTGRPGEGRGDGTAQLAPPGTDPLGRDMAGNGGSITTGDPLADGGDPNRHARDLQDEIRRRSGEQDRPRDERDYLGRLLDRF